MLNQRPVRLLRKMRIAGKQRLYIRVSQLHDIRVLVNIRQCKVEIPALTDPVKIKFIKTCGGIDVIPA